MIYLDAEFEDYPFPLYGGEFDGAVLNTGWGPFDPPPAVIVIKGKHISRYEYTSELGNSETPGGYRLTAEKPRKEQRQ